MGTKRLKVDLTLKKPRKLTRLSGRGAKLLKVMSHAFTSWEINADSSSLVSQMSQETYKALREKIINFLQWGLRVRFGAVGRKKKKASF